MDAEQLFLSQLPLIERIVASICRRKCCFGDEAEDFGQWVKLRLIEDDYAVLRKFRGRSKLSTYLNTVVHNLFRDYRIAKWGKWRPSAAAKRLGEVAMQLETLTGRDGHSLDDAVEILRTNFGVETPPAELEAIAARLPARVRRRFVGEEALERLATNDGVEACVADGELAASRERLEEALGGALEELPGEDRLILKLRFQDGFTVRQVAEALRTEPRPLYTRFERCLRRLRGALEARGVTAEETRELVGWERLELNVDYRAGDAA